ncbi:hypothetical protein BU26DRAFT_140227 [Trematosphaeria pertusa]|uniref:Uncharacterized protein n=1 Tax=Trematosphaeria pertusa TaxID=390896 RepID=A0A6A6IVT2_9PLEO|nr:uncharacterized protein BU26DRAFT_140227 [Trematosphaeria pertusa]KAF2254539.1 hypothetical protein BU26DRAFT_140227 [Trematosphaeria pertusa]
MDCLRMGSHHRILSALLVVALSRSASSFDPPLQAQAPLLYGNALAGSAQLLLAGGTAPARSEGFACGRWNRVGSSPCYTYQTFHPNPAHLTQESASGPALHQQSEEPSLLPLLLEPGPPWKAVWSARR